MSAVLCSSSSTFSSSTNQHFYKMSSIQSSISLSNSPPFNYSNFRVKSTFKGIHSKNNISDQGFQDFSVLSSDVPWDQVWSSMGLYLFSLHIPLSFGGLSVIAKLMNDSLLDTQTEAVSILLIQAIELSGAITLLMYTAKPDSNITSFFQGKSLQERNWVQASAVGFGLLIILVLLTSFLADTLIGPKDVNNPIVKEIISSGPISSTALFFTYCFVTPFLEEIVYRGFLLSSLASKMKWQKAVAISSCIFSAAHLSGENFIQLVIIGCVLGCAYCWSGNLRSSFVLHSLYNAATLMVQTGAGLETQKRLRLKESSEA